MTYRSRSKHGQATLQDDDLMASAIGDLGWLKLALRSKPTGFSSVDKNGFSTIHLAALHGRLDCLRYLIETHEVNVNVPSQHGWRPIHLSISNQTGKRAYECFLYLLEKGADPTVANDDGVTPLHQAACEGHIQCLKMLLDLEVAIDVRDHRGNTPFDLARLWGHRMCAKLLTQAIWHREKREVSAELEVLRRRKLAQAIREIHELQQSIIDKQRKEVERVRNAKDKQLKASPKLKPIAATGANQVSERASETARYCRDNLPISPDIRKAIQVVRSADVREVAADESARATYAKQDAPMVTVRWNPSTRVPATFSVYEPSLRDVYPRDPFSKLPLPFATPVELNPRSQQAASLLGKEFVNGKPSLRLLDVVNDAVVEQAEDEQDKDQRVLFSELQYRPNVWTSNSVLDVPRLKKRQRALPGSDVGFCLTDDPKSFQIIHSLCANPV